MRKTSSEKLNVFFDRERYLKAGNLFETGQFEVGEILREFTNNEDLAYELAVTRYLLAKTEDRLEDVEIDLAGCNDLMPKDH